MCVCVVQLQWGRRLRVEGYSHPAMRGHPPASGLGPCASLHSLGGLFRIIRITFYVVRNVEEFCDVQILCLFLLTVSLLQRFEDHRWNRVKSFYSTRARNGACPGGVPGFRKCFRPADVAKMMQPHEIVFDMLRAHSNNSSSNNNHTQN